MAEAPDVPHGWIVGDDEFGRVQKFRAKLRKRCERYVLDAPAQSDSKINERLLVVRTVEDHPRTHHCLSNAAEEVPRQQVVWGQTTGSLC